MKKSFHSVCVSALAVALLSGCAEKKQAVRAESVPVVETAKPLVADVEEIGSYSVRIRANEDVEIRARVGGYIERVCFEKGARVEKGRLLFKIDDRPFAAALAAAEANVKAAESKIALAEENAQRARGLFKRNAISKEAYQTRETELLVRGSTLSIPMSSRPCRGASAKISSTRAIWLPLRPALQESWTIPLSARISSLMPPTRCATKTRGF